MSGGRKQHQHLMGGQPLGAPFTGKALDVAPELRRKFAAVARSFAFEDVSDRIQILTTGRQLA